MANGLSMTGLEAKQNKERFGRNGQELLESQSGV